LRPSRIFAALSAALMMLLIAAPAALAENGEGLAGRVTDKTVTFFCFGVIAFFALVVIVMSVIQGRLEKRKEMRRSDLERYS
jgi:bacteriorhodopsin